MKFHKFNNEGFFGLIVVLIIVIMSGVVFLTAGGT